MRGMLADVLMRIRRLRLDRRSWGQVVLAATLAGCGAPEEKTPDESAQAVAPADDPTPPVTNPRDQALPAGSVTALRVLTAEPGWTVFVNGIEAVAAEDQPLVTPCVVHLPDGAWRITVSRAGAADQSERALTPEIREVQFDSGLPVPEGQVPAVEAPLSRLAPGESTPLASLNSPARDADPFVSVDGLTIAFASDRPEGRAIYVATRPGPGHHFDTPRQVALSRGADRAASPSLSADGLLLAYLLPERSRVWGLQRGDLAGEFADRKPLVFDDQSRAVWRSAQLSGDGLRIYWTADGDGTPAGFTASRKAVEKSFGKPMGYDLPGAHACLSPDALRQYTFDGREVHRRRRGSLRQSFGEPESIAEVELPVPLADAGARSWWVSEDEQWLFWTGQGAAEDLFVTRLRRGPGWGRTWHGDPLVLKPAVAATEAKPVDVPAPVDPRSLPLPYTRHWRELEKLIAARQFPAAQKLVRSSLEQRELAGERDLLQRDLAAITLIREFWAGVLESLSRLKPGDEVPYGTTRVEFVRFENQRLVLKTKTSELAKPLSELPPAEVVELYLLSRPEPTPQDALRIGVYLSFTPRRYEKVASSRLAAAGDEGSQFREEWFARLVRQGGAEFDRGNLAEGTAFVDEVLQHGSGTAAHATAGKLKAGLYDRLSWELRGNRKWGRDKEGELRAEAGRFERSYAVSREMYGDFELSCEWQVTGATGQGGIYFRYPGQGDPFKTGFKIQLASDAGNGVDQYSTGSLFGQEAPLTNASQAAGQWNTLKLRVVGEDVTATINDVVVLKAKAISETAALTGHVALDGVAGGINYRRVLIVPLK